MASRLPTYEDLVDAAIFLGNTGHALDGSAEAFRAAGYDHKHLQARAARFKQIADWMDLLAGRADQLGLLMPRPTGQAPERRARYGEHRG